MVNRWGVLIFIVFVAVPLEGLSADFSGSVVSVLDGDTIEVLNGHHAERIRLSGIDCPENGQAFGKRAKQAASSLVFGKDVTIQTGSLLPPRPPSSTCPHRLRQRRQREHASGDGSAWTVVSSSYR